MLLNQGELDGARILSRKTVEFMTQNHLSDQALKSFAKVLGEGVGFGLSFWVVHDAAQTRLLQSEGAYGWAGGAMDRSERRDVRHIDGAIHPIYPISHRQAIPRARLSGDR
jgi:hypothetical protein